MSESANLGKCHLATWQTESQGPVDEDAVNKTKNPLAEQFPDMTFLNSFEMVMGNIIQNHSRSSGCSRSSEVLGSGCLRANAAKHIYWDPSKVKAAIVTCGGLCPGLNSIIRGVTKCLWNDYGVRHILGITAGYNGLSDPVSHPPIELTEKMVRDIHMKGGSIIKAARGGFDAEKICDNLSRLGINMLFLVGGDGTQFAGNLLYEAARKRQLPVSIVGIPKSIDNDVVLFDRTFGFDTAVAKASEVIRNAWVEASSCERGVGIVKLMGRDSGFVAMHGATAADVVDLCMIPEVKVEMKDVLAHVDQTLAQKGSMVIAVAEGAGQELVATGEKDATGHTIYGDIGVHLRDTLNKHLKPTGGRTFYIDPSYIIRSVPINPNDHIYCVRLANDAVHTAMRGYTGVCVGALHNVICMLPSRLIATGKKKVRPHSSSWQGCIHICGMPRTLSGLEGSPPVNRVGYGNA